MSRVLVVVAVVGGVAAVGACTDAPCREEPSPYETWDVPVDASADVIGASCDAAICSYLGADAGFAGCQLLPGSRPGRAQAECLRLRLMCSE